MRHNEGGSFLSASGFLCLLHTLVKLLLEVASVASPAPTAGVWHNGSVQAGEHARKNHAGAPDLRAKNGQGWAAVRRGSWCFATGPVVTKCFMWTLKCFFCFCFFPKTSVQYFTKRQKWSLFLANPHITVPFCQTGGWVRGKATARIPSSSLTEVWSAQTWTLGTLFTHVIVTCKPPCRKHKIHLYIFNLQAMTAQTDQGERKRKRKKKREKSRFEEGPYSQRQKC